MGKLEYRDRVAFWAIQITDGHCAYCGKEILCRSDMQLDHTTPIKVKSRSFHNQIIVPSCPRCNSQKGRRTIEEYREYLKLRSGAISVSFYIDKCNPVKFISPNVAAL